jgi:FkbM family methyltransferase
MMYSQNNEEKIIKDYFKDFRGTFLDIGANDGVTLSNTRGLSLLGWSGVLVEPSKIAFEKLKTLYADYPNIQVFNYAIGTYDGETDFFDSGTHLHQGDTSLLSTIKQNETKKWTSETFTQTKVNIKTYASFLNDCGHLDFELISIDAEGMDWEILQQINLDDTKMIIVEFNQIGKDKYVDYCSNFGLKLIAQNHENLIFAL